MKPAGLLPLLVFASVPLVAQAPPADAPAQPGFDREPRVAVLVGAGYYPARSGFAGLRSPSRDVPRLAAELSRQGYRIVALTEQEATRAAVLEAFRNAAAAVEPGKGTVLFFFSGHGYSVQGVNYLAPFDSTAATLATTGVKLATVEELLNATKAARRALIVDAARAGQRPRPFDLLPASPGLHALFSAGPAHVSYEGTGDAGVFAAALIRGLHGDAAAPDGFVTFRGLAAYVRDAVKADGATRNAPQVPYSAGDAADIVLGRKDGLAGALTPAARDKLARARELEKAQKYNDAGPLYHDAGEAGSTEAMIRLGALYVRLAGGRSEYYADAMKCYRKAADLGQGDAMDAIGDLYAQGSGVPRDYAEALKWYRMAADHGNLYGFDDAGGLYFNGQIQPQNDAEAVRWFRKGADAGHKAAMKDLGACYDRGRGVPQDYAEAMRWYRQAAALNQGSAMDAIGDLYAFG